MPSGKHLTAEQKAEIIRLRIDEGLPVWGITKKFGLSRTTVYNTVSEWKEHGKSTISNDEKKPDTVAAVTDSEQENVCENIPADIITDDSENVKTDDILPCAVVDAVANEIDRLYDRLIECDREMQKIRDARNHAEGSLIELKTFLRKNGFGDIVTTLDLSAKRMALTNESPNSL